MNDSVDILKEAYVAVILGGEVGGACSEAANGALTANSISSFIFNSAYCICADRGAVIAEKFGKNPDYLVGDMDSIPAELLQKYQKTGVPQKLFQPEKDYTDGEIALNYAVNYAKEHDIKKICVIGACGGRLDHTLANIFVGTQAVDNDLDIIYCNNDSFLYILKGNCRRKVELNNGRTISLLPLFGKAGGITLQGFKYPLQNAALYADKSMGISNELMKSEGCISLSEGYLLVVQNRNAD